MDPKMTPFAQLEAIFRTYPAWLRPTYFVMALSALVVPYLLPAGGVPSTLGMLLIPVAFLWFGAALSFVWLCIAEMVVRTLNRWSASRLDRDSNG